MTIQSFLMSKFRNMINSQHRFNVKRLYPFSNNLKKGKTRRFKSMKRHKLAKAVSQIHSFISLLFLYSISAFLFLKLFLVLSASIKYLKRIALRSIEGMLKVRELPGSLKLNKKFWSTERRIFLNTFARVVTWL